MSPHRIAESIPAHLRPFIARQDPSLYTPIDHASWRFILRVSKAYFARHAHQKYLDGLRETGISTERIPLVEEMDHCLRRFGWRAVPVSGFIPPAVFMEFQSMGILPIACEMRTLEHLSYTPAPDIVHEAAGHAPIIADQEYADYLRRYGEVSRKAIFSAKDMEVYEAIRALSDIKEDPRSTRAEIDAAQKRLDQATADVDWISEASLLARMNWWTVEYGLVGSLDAPKIYGAGLLSSVGESYNCLRPEVKKIPFTLDCIQVAYDITRPQPQLFVTPDFKRLSTVLDEMAATMAFRKGGHEALGIALRAATVTTVVLDSGIQFSGVVSDFNPGFVRLTGPAQLAYGDVELEGHGPALHLDGFSTPFGRLEGLGKSAASLSRAELDRLDGKLRFESGILLEGKLTQTLQRDGRNLVLTFEGCTVTSVDGRKLFDPDWGRFDLACGERVVSVFGGAADRGRYVEATGGYKQRPSNPKSNLTEENRPLNALYAQVREIREGGGAAKSAARLDSVHAELEARYPGDWLLRLELLELNREHGLGARWEAAARARLAEIARTARDKADMIARGLELLA
jgi:phenylalanine-4-hydroxylase